MTLSGIIIRQLKSLLPEGLKRQLKLAVAGLQDVEFTLLSMKKNGFDPKIVIDVGAYRGEWTRMCKCIFPDAKVLMIEPQESVKADLERVLSEFPDIRLETFLVGPVDRDAVNFYLAGSASSVLSEVEQAHQSVVLPMRTLDALTRGTDFERPDFIKIDVQGYELEVLKGAERVLASVEAVLMELNLIAINEGAPLFHEGIGFMAEKDFQVYDICSFFRRPLDNALWQVDVMFVRKSSPLVASKRWA